MASQTSANGVEDRFDYNEGNHLTGTSTFNPSGLKMSSKYAYDPDGRLVKITGNCQPFSDGLKENIILKDANAPASFTFQLTVTGLAVTPQDDGSFALKCTPNWRDYMYDHNQQTSQAVTMSYVLHLNPGSNSYTYQSTDYIPVNNNPYILSSDIKTNGSSSTNGAALNIYWYDSNHNPVTAKPLETFFNLKTSASWQRYISPNITPPPGAAYAKVMAINYGALDSYFDNIQFEQSSQARGYNYLDNSTFMRGNVRWNSSDAYATVANDSGAFSDGYDGIVNLPSTGSSYLESQVVPVVNQDQSYSLAGFMSTQGVVAGTGGGAQLHAVLLDSAGVEVSHAYSPLIKGDTPWTKYAFSFKPTVTGKVKVRLEIYNASGVAKFDNIRLSSGNLITSTDYDSNKNYVISIKNQLNNTMTLENDSYGQVVVS